MSYKTLFVFLFIFCAPLPAAAKTTPLNSHQPIKAEVVNDNPSRFTIDVEEFENVDADEEAPTFALYTSEEAPKTCGDFSDLDLKYEKPEEHKRTFDLSEHKDVLEALDKYKCVVVKNN